MLHDVDFPIFFFVMFHSIFNFIFEDTLFLRNMGTCKKCKDNFQGL